MQPHAVFNIAEAIFWVVLAVIVALRARAAHPALRRLAWFVAAAFFAFAGTDLVESRTGAWYRPWWLLAYNAACLAVIVGCYARYLVVKKSLDADQHVEETDRV